MKKILLIALFFVLFAASVMVCRSQSVVPTFVPATVFFYSTTTNQLVVNAFPPPFNTYTPTNTATNTVTATATNTATSTATQTATNTP